MTILDLIERIRDFLAGRSIEGQISALIELHKWCEGQIEILKLEIEWRQDPRNKRVK